MRFFRWPMLALLGAILIPAEADARETFHDLEVTGAAESELGRSKLLDVPFYMAGQKHPKVSKDLGSFRSNKRTNSFNKSDEAACRRAFLSAIITFQERAQRMGADAIVDLRSITKHNNLDSATQFRCAAGTFVTNVALTGNVVRFAK